MRIKTYRTIGASVVLVGIATAAVAQMSQGEEAPAEISAPAATGLDKSGPASASTTAVERFEYRVGLLAGVSTTNFWEYIGDEPTAWNAYVLGPTKPALYGVDPAANQLVGDLAADPQPPSPASDEEGWQVRVALGTELGWSDGKPVTAGDVVYTFETVRRLGLGGGWTEGFPAEIEAVVAESDTELRIEFSERPSLRVWPHGIGLAPIMPSHVWKPLTNGIDSEAELYALEGTADVSGGPLQIVSVADDRIETIANPGYAGDLIDSVVYTVFEDETSAVTALESGAIDTVLDPNGLSEQSVADVVGTSGITIERSPANSVRYLGFNLTREPMSEPAFRHGLALLLDREAITETLVPNADPAYTMLTPANRSWYDPVKASSISAQYTSDLEERVAAAVSALGDAGYVWDTAPAMVDGSLSRGTGLTIDGQAPAPLTILTPGDAYDPEREAYTQRIESILEMVGFDVHPVVTDFDTVIDLAFSEDETGTRQYDMYVLGWTLGNSVLPDYYGSLFATESAANSTGYSDAEFGAHLARYEQATALDQAKSALWEMEESLAEDLPYLVLYHPDIVEVYRSDRVRFDQQSVLGGIQGRLGGLADLEPLS